MELKDDSCEVKTGFSDKNGEARVSEFTPKEKLTHVVQKTYNENTYCLGRKKF